MADVGQIPGAGNGIAPANPAASFAEGINSGMSYAKMSLEVQMQQAHLASAQAQHDEMVRQHNIEMGKTVIDRLDKITSKPAGEDRNQYIKGTQKALQVMGYPDTDAFAAFVKDPEGVTKARIALSHLYDPNMPQNFKDAALENATKYLTSDEVMDHIKSFNNTAADLKKDQQSKDLSLRNALIEENNKKKLEFPKQINEHQQAFNNYGPVKDAYSTLSDTSRVTGLLQQNNPTADALVKVAVARAISQGRINENEMTAASGSPAFWDSIQRTVQLKKNGTLDDKDRANMLQVMSTLESSATDTVKSNAGNFAAQKVATMPGMSAENYANTYLIPNLINQAKADGLKKVPPPPKQPGLQGLQSSESTPPTETPAQTRSRILKTANPKLVQAISILKQKKETRENITSRLPGVSPELLDALEVK